VQRDPTASILAAAESVRLDDGSHYRSLAVAAVDAILQDCGTNSREIEIIALENGVVPERYARNFKTFTPGQQALLLKSRAAVVGLGGLGGFVVEILARAGVGGLSLVDGDLFEGHNLNRQILSTHDLLATPKAQAAARRIVAVNPSVDVTVHQAFLDRSNAGRFLALAGVAVDCLDNVPGRFALEAAAKKMGAPLVSAAVAGMSGQVTTIFPEDPGLALIYGNPEESPPKGVERILGCLPQTVALAASIQCAEVLKILLDQPGLLRNRLLLFDLTDNTFEEMRLA
jgi:molybdopterin/thiamine biosynthesis adenylyltransferase